MGQESIKVQFWGARGSIPCSGPSTSRYGGHTACVEVRCGSHLIIFDAGSGIRPLGDSLIDDTTTRDIDILFSHGHIDHLIGLPFFNPLYQPARHVRLWAGQHHTSDNIRATVSKFMSHPLFPIGIDKFQAKVEFHDFRPGNSLTLREGLTVRTAALNHPGGATGYRVDFAGRSVAYLTDIELNGKPFDPAVVALAKDAGLVIVDATYTEEELPAHTGWGHSSWQQVTTLAEQAGAKKLCLFHHDPDHDDDFMDKIAAAAAKARMGTLVAREGLTFEV
ncbi:MAG: MBL fold metallo-hydrolase [Pseudolabrys sp.]|nr:MBL fold metallo-hydrolase [Pseudolabrys sp.]